MLLRATAPQGRLSPACGAVQFIALLRVGVTPDRLVEGRGNRIVSGSNDDPSPHESTNTDLWADESDGWALSWCFASAW